MEMNCTPQDANIFSSNLPVSVVSTDSILISVPALNATQILLKILDDALRHGTTTESLSIPGINLLLPVWILSFWERMGQAIVVQQHWIRAGSWLTNCATSIHPKSAIAQDALRLLDTVSWDLPPKGLAAGLGICDLADFLSESLVHTSIVDAIMQSIARDVRHIPTLSGSVSVQDLTFSEVLRLPNDRWLRYDFDRAFATLQELGDALADGTLTRIVILLNIADIHWALFLVDATVQQIQYGDSLGWSVPQEDVNLLNRWLNQHGFKPFKPGPCLPHGKQLDSFSCAIAMANIARHALFGDALFNDADKHVIRIQEFLNIMAPVSNRIPEFMTTIPDDDFLPGESLPRTSPTTVSDHESELEYVDDDTGMISESDSGQQIHISRKRLGSLQVPAAQSNSHSKMAKPTVQTTLKPIVRDASGGPGLMPYFKRVSHDDYLESVRLKDEETREERIDNARKAAEDKRIKEYERAAKKRLGARERKRKSRAKKKGKTIDDVLHDTPLSDNPYPQGIAEASRPYRGFKEENRSESGLGRKRKHESSLAERVCWQEHNLWSQVLHAVNVVGHPWSPTDILKRLQSTNSTAFASLTTQVIGRWIDRSGPKPKWTEAVTKRAARGRQAGPITRTSILSQYPEVVDSIVDQLRKLRDVGVALDKARCRGIIIGQLYHSCPRIFETTLRDGSVFRASDSWVQKFIHERLNWSFRRSTRASQKLPANLDDVLREHLCRLILTMRNCVIAHAAFDVNIDQTNSVYQPNSTSTFEEVGSKQVAVVGKDEKRAATIVVGASASGDLLPWQLIYEGRSVRSLPSKNCPGYKEALCLGFLVSISNTDTYWSTFELMCEYVTGILVPYWARKKEELGVPPDQECVLRLDVWSVHQSVAFRTWLDKTYPWIRYRFIPGGCTGVAQPCDVDLQRVIKLEIKRRQHADIVDETLALLGNGTPAAELKLDTRIGTLRDRSINWFVHSYNTVNKPEIVKKVGSSQSQFNWLSFTHTFVS